ncbi:MAG: hypothetical protein OEV40_14520 [Acidimicrobiia bacterium]|nr:hypothetical protein [Acidimicrobiia bacterium]
MMRRRDASIWCATIARRRVPGRVATGAFAAGYLLNALAALFERRELT